MKSRMFLACAAVLFTGVLNAQIKINEVVTNANAWVEVVNLGNVPVDISGWRLEGYWDNPANGIPTLNFTFPGIGGSGTVIIAPEQCVVVSENGVDPVTPMGTLRFTGINVAWFTGVPVSVVLTDDLGNGMDYIALGNTNALQAPLFLTGGAPTAWAGPGSPNIGGIATGTTAAATFRHGRVDTDTADDFTNFGAGTPGVLNPFQTLAVNSTGVLPAATFASSSTCGSAPLTVRFNNTSTGQVELASVLWDFDAVNNPGINTAATHHAAFTFPAAQSVNVTITDVLGGMSTSANTLIMANPGGSIQAAVAPCFRQNFENFPALVANPCGGPMVPAGSTGMEYRAADAFARYRIINRNTLTSSGAIAWAFPAASPESGDTVVLLDAVGGSGTNDLIVHIDGTSLGGGSGFRIRYWLLENNDETDPADLVAFQDGSTAGFGTNNLGAALTTPGVDGFREVLLNNWNASPINRVWMQFEHIIDATFLAANGLTMGSDMRFIIRQRDNTTFELNDGLALDLIEVLPLTNTPGIGQPGNTATAWMDLNTCLNLNCNRPGDVVDPNGPYFANATVGGPMAFRFRGEVNQPIILLAGNLNPAVFTVPIPGAGQVDIGITNPIPPFIPTGIVIVADGTQPSFLNSLFNTGPSGDVSFAFATPAFPPGVFATFQAAILNSVSVVAMTNAVQLTIL